MKLQAVISSVALAAALTFSGSAVAQNMLGGVEIPADQIQLFNDKCEALRAESTASLTADDDDDAVDPTETGSTAGAADADDDDDPAAQDNWDEALASLTIEQCDEAGFSVDAM